MRHIVMRLQSSPCPNSKRLATHLMGSCHKYIICSPQFLLPICNINQCQCRSPSSTLLCMMWTSCIHRLLILYNKYNYKHKRKRRRFHMTGIVIKPSPQSQSDSDSSPRARESSAKSPPPRKGKELHVRHLPSDMSEEELRDLFSQWRCNQSLNRSSSVRKVARLRICEV